LRNDFLLTQEEYVKFINKPIKAISPTYKSLSKYPSFNDLVTMDLKKNFKDRDLRTKGLKIITNLDPVIQNLLEDSVKETVLVLQKKKQV